MYNEILTLFCVCWKITSEGDYTLYRVVLFRRAADDFRTACRENRFVFHSFHILLFLYFIICFDQFSFMVRDFVDDNGDNKKATKTLVIKIFQTFIIIYIFFLLF